MYKVLAICAVYVVLLFLVYLYGNSDLLLMFSTLSLFMPIIYLINDRYKQKEHIAHLQEESLKAELALLKSQINPHFFFNTLNNLYGLAIEKSELTSEVIYKLSEMMRFTIYQGRKDSVEVKDEIAYLENFVELHRIRYQQGTEIKFDKNIEDDTQKIPPLLFINLLENAFKHGVETQPHKGFIHFKLTTSENFITFDIKNNYEESSNTSRVNKKTHGIGLDNLTRRLALIYPKRHSFIYTRVNGVFQASIIIDL